MKKERHAEILRLIHEQEIGTQEELAKRLNENGFAVTQATVSRDIRALQLGKTTDKQGRVRYALLTRAEKEEAGRFVRVLRDAYHAMEAADNLIVIKTASGMAMAAAAALDELGWPEIVGCIAGDDTIFCALRSHEQAAKTMERLRKLLEVD